MTGTVSDDVELGDAASFSCAMVVGSCGLLGDGTSTGGLLGDGASAGCLLGDGTSTGGLLGDGASAGCLLGQATIGASAGDLLGDGCCNSSESFLEIIVFGGLIHKVLERRCQLIYMLFDSNASNGCLLYKTVGSNLQLNSGVLKMLVW